MSPSALIFVLAPLPNWVFSHCGGDDFTTDYEGSGPMDLGRFITAIVVVTGLALPLVLAHSEIIKPGACAMSIVGGSCVTKLFIPFNLSDHLLKHSSGLFMAPSWLTAPLSSKKIQSSSNLLSVFNVVLAEAILCCTLRYSISARWHCPVFSTLLMDDLEPYEYTDS